MEHRIPTAARFVGSLILLACAGGHLSGQTTPSSRASGPVDREYTLESTMLGYRGVGGEIDGVRNPDALGAHRARRSASPSSTAK